MPFDIRTFNINNYTPNLSLLQKQSLSPSEQGELDEMLGVFMYCAHHVSRDPTFSKPDYIKLFDELWRAFMCSPYRDKALRAKDSRKQNLLHICMKDVIDEQRFRSICEELIKDPEIFAELLLDKDENESTPLHQFVSYGRAKTLRHLFNLELRPEVSDALDSTFSKRNKYGETPADILLKEENSRLKGTLKSQFDIGLKAVNGWYEGVNRSFTEHKDVMKTLLFSRLVSRKYPKDYRETVLRVSSTIDRDFDPASHPDRTECSDLLWRLRESMIALVLLEPQSTAVQKLVFNLSEAISVHSNAPQALASDCIKAIQQAEKECIQESGLWLNIHPVIRAILGVLATLTVVPMLAVGVASLATGTNYVKTFFSTPPNHSLDVVRESTQNIFERTAAL